MAQAAVLALAPGKDGAAGGDGEAVVLSSRHSDDALASQRLDLLRLPLVLCVAVAQLVKDVSGEIGFDIGLREFIKFHF